jgi:hypothetical protein
VEQGYDQQDNNLDLELRQRLRQSNLEQYYLEQGLRQRNLELGLRQNILELYNIIFNTVSRWSIYLINRKSTGIWIRNYDRDWSRDFNRAIWN